MTRWRLTIEYDGGPFMGWQRQDHGPSVQETLEQERPERAFTACDGQTLIQNLASHSLCLNGLGSQ